MKQLKKYLDRKKRGKESIVPETTTPSEVATIPEEQIVPPAGANTLPNEPILPPAGEIIPPDETIIPPNETITHPSEANLLPTETIALPNGTTNETTVPPSEVAVRPNETTTPASETTAPSPKKRQEDFWKEAIEKLPEEYKEEWLTAAIDTTRENIVGMVKAKMEECKDKQWKIEINGKERVVREVFGKILDWVEKVAAVGDAAVQYDPGHAAIPWAGFRFLLQVAVNDRETDGAMLAGLERATWLTSYCWAQERLYREYFADNDKYSDLNNAFVEDLVHLYTAILWFLIQAHKYYTKGAAARIAGAIISPGSWVRELTQAIDDRKLHMEEYASLVHKSNVHQDLKDVLGRLDAFSEYLSEEETRREEEERQKFMKWLSDIDYIGDHEVNSCNVLKHSGEWMLSREDKFRSWKKEGGFLWLRGIPGAGKTKLTSTIIDHLMKTDENHTVAYFYCIRDTKQPKKEDPEEILRAILKQLVVLLPGQLSDPVKKKYEEEKKKAYYDRSIKSLTFEECARFIVELGKLRPVTIVIDALDECRENKRQWSQGSRTDRQDLLRELMATENGNMKVFLSSRDDVDIKNRLQNYPTITMNASKNGDDILRFIESEVDDLITGRGGWGNDNTLKGDIVTAVDDRAKGMFRFAALQIGYLSTLNTRISVRRRLRNLPTTLCELYDEIYRRILAMEEEESSIAKRALSWLLCASRQLHSSELLAAVSPDPDQGVNAHELLRLCRHLVVLNEVSDSFEFAHLSVREYLETREEYKDGQPHALVAERCIKLFEPEVPRGRLDKYASLYWADHCNSGSQTRGDAVTDMVEKFFRNKGVNPAFETWAKLARDSVKVLPSDNNVARRLRDASYKPLLVISVFGFPKHLSQWTDITPGYNYFRDSEDLVVQLAIKWGNKEGVGLLLQQNAQPTVDKFGLTSLFWAAVYEQLPVLELLKDFHGGVDIKDDMGWTALDWMVLTGHVEGLKLLLSVGAGLNRKDQAKWTPLHWAAFLDRQAEAKELKRYHIADAEDCDGLTPFQWATFLGYEGTAKYPRTGDTGGAFRASLRISPTVKAKVR